MELIWAPGKKADQFAVIGTAFNKTMACNEVQTPLENYH